MGARARGFLLFSFAFSSVLSSPEIAIPSDSTQSQANATDAVSPDSSNSTSVNEAINLGCFREGICDRGVGSIDKREISYFPSGGRSVRDDLEKRARIGFTGMRGKKDSSLQGWGDRSDLSGYLDLLEKRGARMGFNGMRGKKLDGYQGKRSQMAFHGMRGKKSGGDYDAYDDEDGEDYDAYLAPGREEWTGREGAPLDGWDKRSMAFHGMRGRRSDEGLAAIAEVDPFGGGVSGYDFKRAMGFLGMRGKKTPESWSLGDYGKRGYQSAFYGMKGKKAQSGFFGMRGKKSSTGFLGIQGDREALDNEVSTIRTLNSVSPQERVRRAASWLRNSKKAKNAFFAVRGKKSSREDDGSDLNLISSSE